MDDQALKNVREAFEKMVSDNLIYRREYMVNYCPECATVLADIELKDAETTRPLYHINFEFKDKSGAIPLGTTRPEFLFSVTHVLVSPADRRFVHLIGKTLINPSTGEDVQIIASKRKFNAEEAEPYLSPFFPSYKRYDYEYTLRNSIPSKNLLDWQGKMLERYPGLKPEEARAKEIDFLSKKGVIDNIDENFADPILLCKKGHIVESLISLTWFLKIDDEKNPLRKPALDAIEKEGLVVFPKWREKGLVEWMGKMHDWPIARQNVWGIRIPIYYEVTDSAKFRVWFVDNQGNRQYGNLKEFLDKGVTFKEVESNLERLYAEADVPWTLSKQNGKRYLPETDTFDTWFSSGQWAHIVYASTSSADFSYFYPSHSIVIGQDLLRLSVSRKVLLSQYLTGRLPFKNVYLHRLIQGADGQKMSKSLGNVVPLEYYLDKYGADVTRLAMISYTTETEDFILSEERLEFFKKFTERLWKIGRVVEIANNYPLHFDFKNLSPEDKKIIYGLDELPFSAGALIERFAFADALDKLYRYLENLEAYVGASQSKPDIAVELGVIQHVFKTYITMLHPFMPFITEELSANLYKPSKPLSSSAWPTSKN
jgi:valyl-tRNA synthetase